MLIRFQNLGKIKDTTLDLRPLTVIIGPNNSNKTYIAYSVYGLWQAARSHVMSLSDASTRNNTTKNSDGSMSFRMGVGGDLDRILGRHIRIVFDIFSGGLESFYQDSSGKLFSDTRFYMESFEGDMMKALNSLSGEMFNNLAFRYFAKSSREPITARPFFSDDTQITLSGTSRETFQDEVIEEVGIFGYLLSNALFAEPFLLPAERNAFIITYKMLANRRYKALREGYRQAFSSRASAQRQLDLLREGGEVRYPQPVEDFLDFLTDVESAKSPNTRSPFAKIADTIESSIQNTNKTRYRSTALGGKEIITQVEKGLDIDLYNASSSIKQLAPLLLYLRYRAKENDLLIMDEPEMNLHPESQAKLLEVLAMLVNHGVNVLLTTHSPYLMAHLNNLAQADGTSQAVRNRQAKSLYLKNPDSLLRMDQVSAYEMRDNQLHSLKDPDYGIRWDTLSDVSADLQQKYFALYEEGHAKERAATARKTQKTTSGQNGQH